LVIGTDGRSLELRDLAKGQLLRTYQSPIEGASKILNWAVTPDARLVAANARRLDATGQYEEDAGIAAVWESERTLPFPSCLHYARSYGFRKCTYAIGCAILSEHTLEM
jgi:hypothetical protein